jgi:hypothetical protein
VLPPKKDIIQAIRLAFTLTHTCKIASDNKKYVRSFSSSSEPHDLEQKRSALEQKIPKLFQLRYK